MFSKRVLFIAIIAAAAFVFFLTPTTFGCIPSEDNQCQEIIPVQQKSATPTVEASSIARPLAANRVGLKKNLKDFVNKTPRASAPPQGNNTSPVDTSVPLNTQVYIGPHATIWFRVQDAIKRLSVSVDTFYQPGFELYIYSPERPEVLQAEEIGRGSLRNGHELWWSGTVYQNSIWYFKLKNTNDFSVPFALATSTSTDTGEPYSPAVDYAFGTGQPKPTFAAANAKPAAPTKPTAAPRVAAHVPVIIPGSPDPFNAPAPSGTQTYIGPHSTVWYSADDRSRRLNIWMDADPNLGLVMEVYGPDIDDVWHSKPTGVGAPANGFAYFWTGRAKFKGDWKIRITNPNDFSVPYTLTSASISDKPGDLCRDCHGGIGDDQFERCEHEGSFCEDLKDELKS